MSSDKKSVILTIRLFGVPQMAVRGKTGPLPGGMGAQQLFISLLLQPEPQARTYLSDQIWPHLPHRRGLRALSKAIWQIKQVLGKEAIEVTRYQVGLGSQLNVEVDVYAFQQIVGQLSPTATALAEAVKLYVGELAKGVEGDWMEVWRRQFEKQYEDVLHKLLIYERQNGRFASAIEYAQKLVVLTPWDDSLHQEIMRLYAAQNNVQAALDWYADYETRLADSLDITPDATTQAIVAELQASLHEAPVYVPAASTHWQERLRRTELPFIGRRKVRQRLLMSLEAILNETGHQTGGLVLIEGEAGIGKTHLVQQLAQDAQWRQVVVLNGRCQPHQAPYEALVDAILGELTPLRWQQLQAIVLPVWLETLADTFPQFDLGQSEVKLATLPQEDTQRRLYEAFFELLKNWSSINPLLLIIEDLHYASMETILLLQHITTNLDQVPLLVCLYLSFTRGSNS